MRFRLRAFTIHFAASALIALSIFCLVYFVWYPSPLFELSAGKNLFFLVIAVDIVLGPLLTLVVANARKSRRELARDIGAIALVQVSALVYGVSTMAAARPAYIVYNAGQFNVVNVSDINRDKLDTAKPPFDRIPLLAPRVVGAPSPKSEVERSEMIFSAIEGRGDVFETPRFYVPYDDVRAEVAARAKDIGTLKKIVGISAEQQSKLEAAGPYIGYLPLMVRRTIAIAAIDKNDGQLVEIIALEPRE